MITFYSLDGKSESFVPVNVNKVVQYNSCLAFAREKHLQLTMA